MHIKDKYTLPVISFYSALAVLIIYSLYWFVTHLPGVRFDYSVYNFYTYTYGFIALFGSIGGFYTATLWGGFNSSIGKSLYLFSVGLLFQFFGQLTFFYYSFFLKIENPYPSLMEIFYFGSIPIYFLAMCYLAHSVSLKTILSTSKIKLLASIFIPALMAFIAYELFLLDYDFADVPYIVVFLDFGYPIGQALQASVAVTTYFITHKVLGGKLRGAVLRLIYAIFIQYMADLLYTIQTYRDTWSAGGTSDLLYLFSYFVMGYALYQFYKAYLDVVSSTSKNAR